MLRPAIFLLGCLLASPLLAQDGAHEQAAQQITVKDAYARATLPGMKMSAIFMKLYNHGKTEHLLVRAQSDAARFTELHNNIQVDGVMRMREMAHIHLKPGKTKELKSGGLHVMLMGLSQKLVAGENISLQLTFDDESQQTIKVPVKTFTAGAIQ